MRVLAIIALALLLAGCKGDRMKQGTNMSQEQSQGWWPFHAHDAQ
jgi:PBP1b-binding outer membrane lipoprotein LpoB